jgi:hypothetical protein
LGWVGGLSRKKRRPSRARLGLARVPPARVRLFYDRLPRVAGDVSTRSRRTSPRHRRGSHPRVGFHAQGSQRLVGGDAALLRWNGVLLVSAAKQTADAWVGGPSSRLASGRNSLQASAHTPRGPCLSLTLPVALALDAIALLALWRLLRPFKVRRVLAYALKQIWAEYQNAYSTAAEATENWWGALERLARTPANSDVPASLYPIRSPVLRRARWRDIGAPSPSPTRIRDQWRGHTRPRIASLTLWRGANPRRHQLVSAEPTRP